jgi:hydroxyethylthiazole kinase-like uncharacterized protein yjeF
MPLPLSPADRNLDLYLTRDIRAIEKEASARPEPPPLMERAGLAAAELARELVSASGTSVLVFAGPGNNGGDAFVVARHLKAWWYRVAVVFAGDPFHLSEDARKAMEQWTEAGGDTHDLIPQSQRWDLVVDGLFGIGLTRALEGKPAELVSFINDLGAPVLAIDVPSGLEADTGRVMGRAVRATHTATFLGLKAGMYTLDGPDHCGTVHLNSLGLDVAQTVAPSGMLLGAETLNGLLGRRLANSHKGTYGSVGIIGGAAGMSGAALLAGRAALRLGSGRVYVGVLDADAIGLDPAQPELMLRAADAILKIDHLTTLAVGPGLGRSATAKGLVKNAVKADVPLVLDADALNILAEEPILRRLAGKRKAPTLLTPHPAEAARLLGSTSAAVQSNRVAAALELAGRMQAEVVLKGAGSVCASPDGAWCINSSGNPGLATAGQGDVLTGITAALLAQGVEPVAALRAAVHLHGAAADRSVARGLGPIGLTATEVTDAARTLLNQAVYGTGPA